MSSEKIKHLEFIQNVITRMNTNSFQIKGWCIVIVSALLAIYASTKNNYFFLAAVFPSITFWILDAYYGTDQIRPIRLYTCNSVPCPKPHRYPQLEVFLALSAAIP